MGFIFYNSNPTKVLVGDCVIRALTKLLNEEWEKVYLDVCIKGFELHDMPSANRVWENYLLERGYTRHLLPDTCPNCYTVKNFCSDFPVGKYLLATGEHVVTVENGNYFDTWDSGDELPVYYWNREV